MIDAQYRASSTKTDTPCIHRRLTEGSNRRPAGAAAPIADDVPRAAPTANSQAAQGPRLSIVGVFTSRSGAYNAAARERRAHQAEARRESLPPEGCARLRCLRATLTRAQSVQEYTRMNNNVLLRDNSTSDVCGEDARRRRRTPPQFESPPGGSRDEHVRERDERRETESNRQDVRERCQKSGCCFSTPEGQPLTHATHPLFLALACLNLKPAFTYAQCSPD